ncbi:glycerate kinase type-2 family protein [Pelagibacterium luteolum]|uniref:Hydroxypyruvate reductase n=1 Tax=Pelagibacterium luteolum TaxID=440168 RepID=A0A1G7UZQ9_9HYPH|nr:glycerate kinase [Pelagibacterium luteolum]SDG53023.1 hydroxypyruvate reductase [Pelagibacterium luteolum]
MLAKETIGDLDAEQVLRRLFDAALDAALPDEKFDAILPARPKGRTIVLGAGKASARMARAFEDAWGEPLEGLIVTRYGHAVETRHVKVVEAAHPVPDEAGLKATREIVEMARGAGPNDLVVVLISGGASSLLTMPANGISLADKQNITRQLLRSGAPIGAMNAVRKAFSAVKGGKLALAAAPAKVVTYIISDVPGDDPATVGSGPSIVTGADLDDVQAILRRFRIDIPEHAAQSLVANSAPEAETDRNTVHMIATPRMSLDAARREAEAMGIAAVILGDAIEGEAREVAVAMAGIVRSIIQYNTPFAPPCVLLSGGETTVTLRPEAVGRGGRNTEFLLALYLALKPYSQVAAIACDTDGIDGTEENAGAWFDFSSDFSGPSDPAAYLDRNDAYTFFRAAKRLVVTGPTYTNVNDFRAILVR